MCIRRCDRHRETYDYINGDASDSACALSLLILGTPPTFDESVVQSETLLQRAARMCVCACVCMYICMYPGRR